MVIRPVTERCHPLDPNSGPDTPSSPEQTVRSEIAKLLGPTVQPAAGDQVARNQDLEQK